MARKIRDADDARSCLDAAARSRLPRAEWARRNGVDARSLNAWRLALARQKPAPFLELVPAWPLTTTCSLTLRCRPWEVVVTENTSGTLLRRAIAAVTAC